MTCFIITFRKCNENEEYRKKNQVIKMSCRVGLTRTLEETEETLGQILM